MKILHIVPELKLGCGVSSSVYSATEAMKGKGCMLFIVANNIDDYYRNKLSRMGVSCFIAPLSQDKKNLLNLFKSVLIITKFIKKEKITLIHSHHRWNCLIGTICARLCSAKSITSDHNILYGKKYLSFWADGIITDSEYNKNHLIGYFHVPEKKIRIVASLIEKSRYGKLLSGDFRRYKGENKFSRFRENNGLLVGQIGRLSEEKGQEFLLEVISEVVKVAKNTRFLFLGDGPFKERLLEKSRNLSLSDKVYFLGRDENVLDFLAILDVALISSKREGFCIAAAEAILAGLSVVATNVGGLPEQIKDGVTGFLIDPGDRKSYEEKLIYLIQNPKILKEMGEKGKSYFLNKHSYEKISGLLEEAYKYFISVGKKIRIIINMEILNVAYGSLTRDLALDKIVSLLKNKNKADVLFLNADCLYRAQKDEEYRNILNSADLVLPDGIGLKIALKILGGKMEEDCNGTDFSPLLMRKTAEEGYKIFFLGSKEGVAEKAAENIKEQIPGIQIVGTHNGFFSNDERVINKINASGADILFVAMGVPLQEKWIAKHRGELNPRLCIGVGALFDYLSGRIPRAPLFIRKMHLEWFWRIFIEPKRMFKRYVIDGAKLGWIVLKYKLTNQSSASR